jgi:hypothetical protein
MGKPISIFICGVQKGGTTSLYSHLREHPALSAPSTKELHFFDDEGRDWSRPDYGVVDAYFASDDGDRNRFEATPIYCFWPPSIERIHAYNSAAKLIFLFRDPFERAWSQWQMEYARGDETVPFSVAIREGRHRLDGLSVLAPERRVFSYIERGFYAEQVIRVLRYFTRDQTLFLRSQDLFCDLVATLKRISEFLEIDVFPDTGPRHESKGSELLYSSGPSAEDRAYVSELVRGNVRAFSLLTGLDVSDWPTMLDRTFG